MRREFLSKILQRAESSRILRLQNELPVVDKRLHFKDLVRYSRQIEGLYKPSFLTTFGHAVTIIFTFYLYLKKYVLNITE